MSLYFSKSFREMNVVFCPADAAAAAADVAVPFPEDVAAPLLLLPPPPLLEFPPRLLCWLGVAKSSQFLD